MRNKGKKSRINKEGWTSASRSYVLLVEVVEVTVVPLKVVVVSVLVVDVVLEVELVLEVDDVELVDDVVDVVVSARLVTMNSTTREKPWGVPLSTT